ncbi:hypothetical protein GGS20DRAFT_213750 [Poronia punctata]|nr:hypothetical protein GGS20DRAFT_213750 [Poronia punctata]
MYRNNQNSQSGPPYDGRYDSYQPPPPPPSDLPPPPPPQQWSAPPRRDSYYSRDRSDEYRPRGPYSDLRYSDRADYSRDDRGSRNYSRDNRDDRDARDRRDNRGNHNEYRPPRGEFTFRQDAPGGINSYRPDRSDAYTGRHHESRRTRGGQPYSQSRRNGPYQRRGPEKASDRILLSKKFDEESEPMLGDRTARASYRNIDDLSDSDETDMDISDTGEADVNTAEPPAKRARTNTAAVNQTQDAPKWSNPDPYTALPPPDTNARKKDVVQLIRKARVEAEAQKLAVSAEAADFISCDLSDDDSTFKLPQAGANEEDTNAHSTSFNGLKRTKDNAPKSINTSNNGYQTSTAPVNPSLALPLKPPVSVHSQTADPAVPLDDNQPTQPPQSVQHTQSQSQSHRSTKQGDTKSAPVDLVASTSLGNRKRNIDDEIKLPHAHLKKVNRMASAGGIVAGWEPAPGEDPCPWAVVDHSTTPNEGTRLHKEIVDFYEYVRPRDFEEKVRRELVSRLDQLVRRKWRDARVLPFGSFMSGLYLPTADMDIAICSEGFIQRRQQPFYDKKKYLFHMKSHLEVQRVAYGNKIDAIVRAKVPLLKYTDDYTGLKVDISFEKMDGQKAIGTFLKWKKQYPAMPPLVALIKHFLLMRGLNEPVNGGIGGFSVICMVVHLLQMMPEVQSGSMKAEEHLGEIFMRFLRYYGKEFNYQTIAIRMNPPGVVNKAKATSLVYRNLDRLSIIDPNNPENDISGGSSNYCAVQDCFSRAYDTLQQTMMLSAQGKQTAANNPYNTLLGPLFAGRYSTFEVQRRWLEKIARENLPPPPIVDAPRTKYSQGFW